MKEQEPIKSFAKLDETLTAQKQAEISQAFERGLKGRFAKVSPGMFDSQIPEIESIIITPVISEKGRPSINATIKYFNQDHQPRQAIFSIFEDGVISGRMPPDLNVSRQDLSLEILKAIGRINFDFWRQTDLAVLPESEEAGRSKAAPHEREPGEETVSRPLNRIERLEFLEHQPRIICGFVNRANGFKGYHGAVFPTFILLEHPQLDNAAYLVDIKPPLEVKEEIFNKPPEQRVDQETYKEILARTWQPISKKVKSRDALKREFHAQRVIHTPKTWQRKLQEAIDARLKMKEAI